MRYLQHFNKPNISKKLSNKILASVSTTHEQTTKYASFWSQNKQTTECCGLHPTTPTDKKMAPPVQATILSLYR